MTKETLERAIVLQEEVSQCEWALSGNICGVEHFNPYTKKIELSGRLPEGLCNDIANLINEYKNKCEKEIEEL